MDRMQPLLPAYTALLARYACTDDEIVRETALGEAAELAKRALADGPLIDQLHELHRLAQTHVAQTWCQAAPGSAEHAARERLVRGDALPLLLALVLPHELAQRAHHEKRWRREHETLVAMFEQTDDLIVVLDADGQCDDVNPAFCACTGWSRREAVEGAAAWAQALPAGTSQRRTEQMRRDGSHFPVQWSVSPILGPKGELLSHVCIGRDVDRQQKVENSLRENDKLRAVATLAGGIAHDFNNLLGSIMGLAELCELEAAAGSRQARNLGRIREAGVKAAVLVRQMLDFSRQTPRADQRVLASELLAHAQGLLQAALPLNMQLSTEVLGDGTLSVDISQMEQVLFNLANNAAHAMRDTGGVLRIVVDHDDPHPAVQAPPPGQPGQTPLPAHPARHLRLRMIDSGSGMDRALVDKIFEPFFTTKPVGEGTGLGLAAVHGIVASHGGRIEVESTPGIGTTFSIYLPLCSDALQTTAAGPTALPSDRVPCPSGA